MIFGFNTSKIDDITLKSKVEHYLSLGCNAVEIGMMDLEREKQIMNEFDSIDWDSFEYVSLHTPVRDFVYKNDEATHGLLSRIKSIHDKINLKLVVIHPNIVEDWSVFKKYDLPFAVENMDNRKEVGRTAESLEEIFSRADAKMVLDLNHCFVIDSSMELAANLYFKFKSRISEIHLSGHEILHDPLYKTKQTQIIKAVPNKNIPIIVELAQYMILDDITQEYNYIQEELQK